MSGHVKPEDVGHWEGDTFVFTKPHTLTIDEGGGYTRDAKLARLPLTCREVVVKELYLGNMTLGEGVTPYDVVHAMLNPIEVTSD